MIDWELRIVRALLYDEQWVYNETFHHKYVYTNEGDDTEAVFWHECKLLYSSDFLEECDIVNCDNSYELIIKRTKEPVLVMCTSE